MKKAILCSVLVFAFSFCLIQIAHADELSDLQEQVKIMQKQIEKMQKKIDALEAERTVRIETPSRIEGEVIALEEKLSKIEPLPNILEGISIGAGATFVFQGTHNANGDSQSPKEDAADASYSIDLELEKEFNEIDGKALMHLETGQGAGVEDELKVFSNVNKDANTDTNVRIAEVYYEQNLFAKKMALTFGKLDPAAYIDNNEYANDETTQFLGRIFKNSPTIEFPDNSAGIRLSLEPAELIDLNFVVQDADADWEDVFDGIFLAGQLNFKPKLLGREGSYRLLGWLNDRSHIKWLDTTKDKEEGYGFGISLDQALSDNLGLFYRYGWQNPKVYLTGSSFSLEQAYSVGLQLKGSLWKRPDDVLAFAIGQAMPSDDYKEADSTRNAKNEGQFECYYNFKVNEHLALSPDLEVIWNPYGKDAANGDDTILVGGLRGQVDF